MTPIRFELTPIKVGTHDEFTVARVVFNDDAILKSLRQSYLKSRHTNAGSQNGASRPRSKKFDKQLEGILGEIAAEHYVQQLLAIPEGAGVTVHRYDDVRTDDFKSPKGEYDLRILGGVPAELFRPAGWSCCVNRKEGLGRLPARCPTATSCSVLVYSV